MHSRNIPITRPPFRIITRDAFRETHKDSAQKHSVIGDLHQFTANTILAHYLGGAWLRRYIDPSSRHVSPYLRIDAEAELEVRAPQYMRYWEFAETLLNMQDVPGFETVLDELIHGKIESACGELYVARMIMFHGLRFRFVSPVGGIGQNYDFDVYYKDGFKMCVEAAAKFETTKPRATSILQSIKDSRAQLPDNEPGIILIKVPQNWLEDISLAEEINRVAAGYLAQSDKIMSIKFYAPFTVFLPGATARWHAYREVSNLKFPERDWDMFRDETVPLGGMPLWWIRFYPALRIPNDDEWRHRPILS